MEREIMICKSSKRSTTTASGNMQIMQHTRNKHMPAWITDHVQKSKVLSKIYQESNNARDLHQGQEAFLEMKKASKLL